MTPFEPHRKRAAFYWEPIIGGKSPPHQPLRRLELRNLALY
jgi:hypothetical protein